jgi:enoyl-CoA hydratase
MSGVVHYSVPKDGVALLEIDCQPSNALGNAPRAQMASYLTQIDADLTIRAVVLTGRGTGFCAGDDLREASLRGSGTYDSLAQFGSLLDQVEALRVPVIGAINGHCIGGGLELALCCDIRLAAPHAQFVAAGVNVGLMASVYRLPRLIGIARAKAIVLTGKPVNAQTALDYGLVTEVFDADNLTSEALSLASYIATRAPLSVEASKAMIAKALDLTATQARAAMGPQVQKLVASKDYAEGTAAFIARRKPKFTRS